MTETPKINIYRIHPCGDLVEEKNLTKVKCHCGGELEELVRHRDEYSGKMAVALRCKSCRGRYTAQEYRGREVEE